MDFVKNPWIGSGKKNQEVQPAKEDFLRNLIPRVKEAREFHQTLTVYRPTSLHNLQQKADKLGINKLYVKDESERFGLQAFKGLGASFALNQILKNRENDLPSKDLTFVTATDGNHGRGLAWAAKSLGHHSVVFLPKGTDPYRLRIIEEEGAKVILTDSNYDDTVMMAEEYAQKYNGILVQDTMWEGYKEIPQWIIEGYGTIALETIDELEKDGVTPTHIFLQAGVGSFAAAMMSIFKSYYDREDLTFILVEPARANCFYQSFHYSEDTRVEGDLNTVMAGLACGKANPLALYIAEKFAAGIFSVEDDLAEKGVDILARPLGEDPKIIAGESGAVTMGVLESLCKGSYRELRSFLDISDRSVVLTINTEGNTSGKLY